MENDDPWRGERKWLARAKGNSLSAIHDLDLKSELPVDIPKKVDPTSMAHSLEARLPLLDRNLVQFAATIPPEPVLDGNGGTQLFKAARRNTVADEVLDRRKRNFARSVLLSRRPRQ